MEKMIDFKGSFKEHPILGTLSIVFSFLILALLVLLIVAAVSPQSGVLESIENLFK
jgi:uncharacterized metal-binding protein